MVAMIESIALAAKKIHKEHPYLVVEKVVPAVDGVVFVLETGDRYKYWYIDDTVTFIEKDAWRKTRKVATPN